MATTPPNQQQQPIDPPAAADLREIARMEDGTTPLYLDSLRASDPFVTLLAPTDSVLQSKGGIANLKLYTELLRDDQVATCWAQRRLALTSCDTIVEPGGDDPQSKAAAEALQAELDCICWDDVTDKALFALFYGWGIAEVLWKIPDEGSATPSVSFDRIVVRDRSRFRFDRDRNVHLWTSGSGWRQVPERKFWPVTFGGDNHDQPYGLGLAHALFWPVFFKRNDIKFWLVFLEKFGQPTAIAKLTKAQLEDPAERAKALRMLRAIATDAGVAVPTNDQGEAIVELLEAARSGAADYQAMKEAMDAAISKIIVGQTMTTDNGSSMAQAKVHLSVRQDIVEADADLLCDSFNRGPVQWWTQWNFPEAKPPRVYRATEPPEDLNARAERDGKIAALGFEPEESYILETYGKGWKKKQAPAMAPGLPGPLQQPGNADPQQFAEGEGAALQALRAARRGDQQALVEAATAFAEQYDSLVGRQVGALLQAAEDAGDFESFRERLNEIVAAGPAPEAVQAMSRGSFFARLMGALRQQRRT